MKLLRTLFDRIVDRDGDTSVETERTSDDDTIRLSTAATERVTVAPASPHLNVVGDTRIQGNVAIRDDVQRNILLHVLGTGTWSGGLTLLSAHASDMIASGNNFVFRGVRGTPTVRVAAGSTGHEIAGLEYQCAPVGGGAGTVVNDVTALYVRPSTWFYTGTVNIMRGAFVASPLLVAGNPSITSQYGVYIADQAPADRFSSVYSLYIDNLSYGTTRYLIEARGATSANLRLEAGDPAANQTQLLLSVNNGTVVLRRVELGPPNSAGVGYRMLRVAN